MAIVERDVVLQSKDADGNQTIDFPITRLANVENTADVKAALENEDYLAIIDSSDNGQMKKIPAEAFAKYTSDSRGMEAHIKNKENPHSVTKEQVGLGNVDNTTDADKPISTAVQNALNGKQDKLSYVSNDNLLDNCYFVDPINQRGKTEYTGNGYAIDRFIIFNTILSLQSDGIVLSRSTDGVRADFVQRLDFTNISVPFTLSALVDDCTAASDANAYAFFIAGYDTPIFFVKPGLHSKTFTKPISGIQTIYSSINPSGGSMKLRAAKLELGSHQTLAHQDENGSWVLNDPPPNKAIELAKYYRYFRKVSGVFNGTAVDGFLNIPLPFGFRTTPSVSRCTVSWIRMDGAQYMVSNECQASVIQEQEGFNFSFLAITSPSIDGVEFTRYKPVQVKISCDISADL